MRPRGKQTTTVEGSLALLIYLPTYDFPVHYHAKVLVAACQVQRTLQSTYTQGSIAC